MLTPVTNYASPFIQGATSNYALIIVAIVLLVALLVFVRGAFKYRSLQDKTNVKALKVMTAQFELVSGNATELEMLRGVVLALNKQAGEFHNRIAVLEEATKKPTKRKYVRKTATTKETPKKVKKA